MLLNMYFLCFALTYLFLCDTKLHVIQVHYGEVNFVKFLPFFFEGLHEKHDPLKFLAHRGTHEMLEYIDAPALIQALPAVMHQIYALFETNDKDIVCETLKCIQTLVLTHPTVGPELVCSLIFYFQLIIDLLIFHFVMS